MKYLLLTLAFLLPSISLAAPLTVDQATSLIQVVQSSPGTPASAFTQLITTFSNITQPQAESLIAVVQASPGAPVDAFVNLLISFTVDTLGSTLSTPAPTPAPTPTPAPVVVSSQMDLIIRDESKHEFPDGSIMVLNIYLKDDSGNYVQDINRKIEYVANDKVFYTTTFNSKLPLTREEQVGTTPGSLFMYRLPLPDGATSITVRTWGKHDDGTETLLEKVVNL